MKKLLFTLSVLALTLVMVSGVQAQSGVPIYNKAYVVFEHYGVISTTANDTTRWINIDQTGSNPRNGGLEVDWFARTNDSMQAHIYYQLRNTDANYTGAWVKLDSIITVDDAVSNNDTTVIGVAAGAANRFPSTTLKGANQMRFYFDYNAGTVGTASISVADGVANRFRFYIKIKPTHYGM